MKTLFVIILFLLSFTGKSFAQYDSIALAVLDSMSSQIGDLETCSYSFYTEYDIPNKEYGLITHSETGDVFLKGPDKMFIEKKGDKGHKEFYFDGKTFLLYSYDRNQYATMPATMSIMGLIDSLSSYFGVEFPGADIFYPDFVDNLLETSDNLLYLGFTFVGNTECHHIAGTRDDMTYQIWLSLEEHPVPVKLSLVYLDRPDDPRYSIIFKDWKMNPYIDDSKFEFTIPVDAQVVKLIK